MTNESMNVRKMLLSDMDSLMRLKNAEKWNQREKDWQLLIEYENSVNLVAELDNKVVGSITGINYANTVAWIGMMLVEESYRGKGISKRLLNDTIELLDGCDSIKLDATPAGQPVYKRIGFIDEHTIYRITNPAVTQISMGNHDYRPEQVTIDDVDEISDLDQVVFGADRSDLMSWLFNDSPELAWLIRENDAIVGFCLGRKGLNFTQIGPVHARSDDEAKAIIQSAINQISGHAVVIDLLTDKTGIEAWLRKHGFTTQRPFERMYLNHNPHPGIVEKQYGISGPELG
jgi:GNAT superfamily N-acetyltransferase